MRWERTNLLIGEQLYPTKGPIHTAQAQPIHACSDDHTDMESLLCALVYMPSTVTNLTSAP